MVKIDQCTRERGWEDDWAPSDSQQSSWAAGIVTPLRYSVLIKYDG